MSTADSHIGRRLGPLVLEERLGDHGAVYHAIHVEQRRSAAVRLLDRLPAPSNRAIQEFARELMFLQTLQHPNVVTCHGGGVEDLQPYLVTELVRGESLDERLRREGSLPWPTALSVARQISAALTYVDHRGAQHLRLVPAKILLGDDGVMHGIVKVADFRRPRGTIGFPAVEPREELIALAYKAPEQICGKPPVSPSTDVYALGCLLFHMLAGRPPFVSDSPRELAQMQLTADPPRLAVLLPDCPVWLDPLVAQLLDKDPRKRPESAAEVGVAIEETQHKLATGASVAEHVLSGGATAIRPKQADGEVRQLLPARKKAGPQGPFYEQVWFLGACLALLLAIVAWVVWPASNARLLERAEELMASNDRDAWQVARRDYLEPLLARSPPKEMAERAQAHLDRIEMVEAEERLERPSLVRVVPPSPGEKLYVQARQYERFGDPATALAKYEQLIESLDAQGSDRAFIKLAQRQAQAIRGAAPLKSAAEVLDEKLKDADDLAAKGAARAARNIWDQIFTLYKGRDDVRPQHERAHRCLLGLENGREKPEPPEKSGEAKTGGN